MRCTVAGLTPCARASVRQLQCVAVGGVVWGVAVTMRLTLAAVIVRRRPRPGATSTKAFGPPDANRPRHNKTVGRLMPKAFAIALLASPSAANRMTWHRIATLCGALCARVQVSKRRRSSGSITIFLAGSHMGPQGSTVIQYCKDILETLH